MLDGLFIVSLIRTCVRAMQEACEPVIPAENWANKELYNKDLMSGMSSEELTKNLRDGKYRQMETYPEPHRDSKTGKIIIENDTLYKEDYKKYGAYQTGQWVKQGKYNLTPEEMERKREEFKKRMEYMYSLL